LSCRHDRGQAALGVRAALASARRAISGEDPALVELLPAFVQLLQSEDAKEARCAVQEHARPVFQGR
jgi:hypothetical protein